MDEYLNSPAEVLLCDGGGRRIDAVRTFGRVALCDPRHLQFYHFDLRRAQRQRLGPSMANLYTQNIFYLKTKAQEKNRLTNTFDIKEY